MSNKKITAKQYLEQLKVIDAKINQKIKERDELRLLATSTGSLEYSKERVNASSTGDTLEKKVIKYVDLEKEINETINEFVDKKHKIIDEIQGLDGVSHIDILFKKYVENKRLGVIATEMKYSYSRVKHLHTEALQAFESKYLKSRHQITPNSTP